MLTEARLKRLRKKLEQSWLSLPSEEAMRKRFPDFQAFGSFYLMHLGRVGPFSNWVMPNRESLGPEDFQDMFETAEVFFSEKRTPYSWEVFEEQVWLVEKLEKKGFAVAEQIHIMLLDLSLNKGTHTSSSKNKVITVTTPAELRAAMKIDDSYDEYNEEQFEKAFRRSLDKLHDSDLFWFLGLDHGKPVASASMSLMSDQKIAYLSGGTTLLEFRRRGFYTDLLEKRLQMARQEDYDLAATHADTLTSAPILKQYGFQRLSTISVYQRVS